MVASWPKKLWHNGSKTKEAKLHFPSFGSDTFNNSSTEMESLFPCWNYRNKPKTKGNYRVSHNTGHLEKLAKSQALYKHELDT